MFQLTINKEMRAEDKLDLRAGDSVSMFFDADGLLKVAKDPTSSKKLSKSFQLNIPVDVVKRLHASNGDRFIVSDINDGVGTIELIKNTDKHHRMYTKKTPPSSNFKNVFLRGNYEAHFAAGILEEQAKTIRELGTAKLNMSIKISESFQSNEFTFSKHAQLHPTENKYKVRLSNSDGQIIDTEISLAGDITSVKDQIVSLYPQMKVIYIILIQQ